MDEKLFIGFVARNPRLSIALPDGLLKALERWAEAEGNKPTSLATFLLEKAIRDAMEEGKIPPAPLTPSKVKSSSISIKDFLTQIVDGNSPTNDQLATLGHDLGVEIEVLMELRDLVRRGNGNKKEEQTNRT